MKKLLILCILFISILVTAGVRADDGLTVTGEKGLFTVLTSDSLLKGKWSFGVSYNNFDRDPLDVDISYYSVTFGFGITDNLEFVGMVTPYAGYDIDPKIPVSFLDTVNGKRVNPGVTGRGSEYRDGFGDIQVGAKYTFVRMDNGGVGVRGFVKIPTADDQEGVGTGKADFGFDFIASGTVGGGLGLAGNAGFTFKSDPKLRNLDGSELVGDVDIGNPFRWGVGANFPPDGSVQGVVEFTGEILPDDAEFDDSTDLTLGLRLKFGESWYLSGGYRRNLSAESDNAENPNGAVVLLSYAPGRGAGEAIPPPPAPPSPPPAPPAPPAPPSPPAAPPEFVWPEVYFPFDQYVITPEERAKIDSVVTYMTDHPNVSVTIEGHCCFIGTDEYNLALGQNRADAIRDYMAGKGVSVSRLRTVSYGESRPKYDNEKEITRRFNRRGFFVVLKPE